MLNKNRCLGSDLSPVIVFDQLLDVLPEFGVKGASINRLIAIGLQPQLKKRCLNHPTRVPDTVVSDTQPGSRKYPLPSTPGAVGADVNIASPIFYKTRPVRRLPSPSFIGDSSVRYTNHLEQAVSRGNAVSPAVLPESDTGGWG